MQKEFDYDPEEIDEQISVKCIPTFHHSSLSSSRSLLSSRRVLRDLENYIEDAKNKENMRFENMRQRQKNIGEKVVKHLQNKQMKIKELEKEAKNKMMKECTFKPKTNPSSGKNRDFGQFLESQKAHTQKIQEKREKLKKNIDAKKKATSTHKPTINKKKQSKQKENKPIHERLYALKDKEVNVEVDEGNNTFRPQINEKSKNMVRMAPVQDLLYNEAVRRQERDNEVLLGSTTSPKFQKPINHNNQRFAAQKFIKEFFFILNELEIDSSSNSTVQYVMFNEILRNLGFAAHEGESQSQLSIKERTLIHDAYQILEGTKPNARNICVLLLGIIGIYNINPVNFNNEEEDGDGDGEIASELCLDECEGRKIQKHFDLFFRNRLSSDIPNRYQESIQKYTFHPKINPISQQMAEKHRREMLEQANVLIEQYPELSSMIPEDGIITHTDLLVLNKIAKDFEKDRKKIDRESEELKSCTFKPNTLSSSLTASKMNESSSGYKKCFELYSYHQEVKNKKESLTASRQHQLDPECTFKPQINRQRIAIDEPVEASKQTEETLFRMHKGREEYEKKKKFLERGEKIQKQKVPQQQREPILLLDVNLGEEVDKIELLEGDEKRLDEIARIFSEKHGLDQESQSRLIELLENELKNVLLRVEEDELSEDDDYN